MKAQLIKLGILFGVAGILFTACDKSEADLTPSLSDKEITLAQDDIAADEIYDDIDASIQAKLVEFEESGYQSVSLKSAEDDFTCLEVTVDHPDSTRFPKVITFDYGTGCRLILNGDTLFKEGKVIVTLTDRFFIPGAKRIVTFEDFYMNEMQVEGVITNTFIGKNDKNNLVFNMKVEDGKLSFADQEGNSLEYTRDADFTKEWDRERIPAQDTIYRSGSMWGVNAEGLDYSREITETLMMVHCRDYGRRWVIVAGKVLSTIDGVATETDYNDGGCDGTAEVVRNGQHYKIRIRELHRNRHRGGN